MRRRRRRQLAHLLRGTAQHDATRRLRCGLQGLLKRWTRRGGGQAGRGRAAYNGLLVVPHAEHEAQFLNQRLLIGELAMDESESEGSINNEQMR